MFLLCIVALLLLSFSGCTAKDKVATIPTPSQVTPTEAPSNTPSQKATIEPVATSTDEKGSPEIAVPDEAYADPISYSGNKPTVVDGISLGDWLYRATLTYSGDKYVMAYDIVEGKKDLAVTSIGEFNGSFLLAGNKTHSVEIEAEGQWELVISPIQIIDTMNFSGSGYAVSELVIGDDSLSGVYTLEHKGTGSFLVMLYASGQSPKLVASKIGEYSGETQLTFKKGRTYIWSVRASDGDWEITKVR